MMRFSLIAAALMLTACSQESPPPDFPSGTYAGEGRNRLCVTGDGAAPRAGVIVYGSGDSNCSASGSIAQASGGMVLVPRGEGECRIPLAMEGGEVRLGPIPSACSYYCGPGASFEAARFTAVDQGAPVTDIAGDPLC